MSFENLPYNPKTLPRELKRHYICASDQEIQEMLTELGLKKLEDLYSHVPAEVRMGEVAGVPEELGYEKLVSHMESLAKTNEVRLSFLGHGLQHYQTPEVVPHILNLRNLTTAYTPYQPERSQGTLTSIWIYQSTMAMLTGFEAVNASFYDRATASFEAIKCAQRLKESANTAVVFGSLFPGDLETLKTQAKETDLRLEVVPFHTGTGTVNFRDLENVARRIGADLACIVFPQVNAFGNLEDVDAITNLAEDLGVKSVAVVDPMLLAHGGLKPPSAFGRKGAHMFAAEAQHLAIGPNFGGPGLGVFGIRFNAENRNDIRQTAGRFIGKGKDLAGRDCLAIVLSTREQHIRREKATSNICSNQSYLATLVGASLLERGDEGLRHSCSTARKNALYAMEQISQLSGIELSFPHTPFFHEISLRTSKPVKDLIEAGRAEGLHVGVDLSSAVGDGAQHLLISFTDRHKKTDIDRLVKFLGSQFNGPRRSGTVVPHIPERFIRTSLTRIPRISPEKIRAYYTKLGEQNVSPDDHIYALGSCTMKYNPYINDYAAGLPGFADLHPEAPESDAQGTLQLLWETQEYFKGITGLAGVTTQPVAGAQGELVGIKMFQAYHRDRGESRDILLIPRSAHGTNPATATMAGFGVESIKLIEADPTGQMDMDQVKRMVGEYGPRIAGIMVTNPNTAGIFETRFKEVADLVHQAGGLVYMDGANMNAIAGWVDLGKLGVDAVHNNTHKTWSIPHGGGGPGDAFVAVSSKLLDYMPGVQCVKSEEGFRLVRPKKSIGSFHRHMGNFGHKVRAYTYVRALGKDGVRRMSAVAVLSARYLHKKLSPLFPTLPAGAESTPRMHEFILTLSKESFSRVEGSGIQKSAVIPRIGKLFLDFGLHAPTVAFPEVFGLMIEPTETFSKAELDDFVDTVKAIHQIVHESPEVLNTVPHFTPIDRVDEVLANKNLQLSETLSSELPPILPNRVDAKELLKMNKLDIWKRIRDMHAKSSVRG